MRKIIFITFRLGPRKLGLDSFPFTSSSCTMFNKNPLLTQNIKVLLKLMEDGLVKKRSKPDSAPVYFYFHFHSIQPGCSSPKLKKGIKNRVPPQYFHVLRKRKFSCNFLVCVEPSS